MEKLSEVQIQMTACKVPVTKTEFRNYENSQHHSRVSQFYHDQHVNQTLEFVLLKKKEFCKLNHMRLNIWDAILLLDEIIDNSDPDMELSQITHLLQTAESIRKAWPLPKYDWFHLTGLIHDLGKLLSHPKLFKEPQWAVVGDTFPVGCAFSEKCVFYSYFQENLDWSNPQYRSSLGIYREHIGLDNVHFSWGHDEYFYQVCKQNECLLPPEALYIIRYHSFYPWHSGGAYMNLCNENDLKMLHWVKEFQKHDLYSKLPVKPDTEKLLPYYRALIKKYFPKETLNW